MNDLKAELAEFKRRRICEEACHLFFAHGYEGTTIDAIAERLTVTKPFIYSYYKNKGEILFDIAKVGITLSSACIDSILKTNASTRDQLKMVVDQVTRVIFDNQEYIVVYEREEKNLDQQQARQVRKLRSDFDHKLASILEKGNADGSFKIEDPALTSITIGGMMTWVSLWYHPMGKWSEAEITAHLIKSVERIVFAQPSPANSRTE